MEVNRRSLVWFDVRVCGINWIAGGTKRLKINFNFEQVENKKLEWNKSLSLSLSLSLPLSLSLSLSLSLTTLSVRETAKGGSGLVA